MKTVFVNRGSDENLLKSLVEKPNVNQEELLKAIDKSKLVQVEIQVKGKNGMYTRKQWKSAGDVKEGEKVIGGTQPEKKSSKLSSEDRKFIETLDKYAGYAKEAFEEKDVKKVDFYLKKISDSQNSRSSDSWKRLKDTPEGKELSDKVKEISSGNREFKEHLADTGDEDYEDYKKSPPTEKKESKKPAPKFSSDNYSDISVEEFVSYYPSKDMRTWNKVLGDIGTDIDDAVTLDDESTDDEDDIRNLLGASKKLYSVSTSEGDLNVFENNGVRFIQTSQSGIDSIYVDKRNLVKLNW